MKFFFPLIAVCLLSTGLWQVGQLAIGPFLCGVLLPYLGAFLFLLGFCLRVIGWGRAPVPFNISLTTGQAASLPWLVAAKTGAPRHWGQVLFRLLLDFIFFRPLFRQTRSVIYQGKTLLHLSTKGLWVLALLFHYSLFIILIRHLRFFLEPIPWVVEWISLLDGHLELGTPNMYLTDLLFLSAVILLIGRRLWSHRLRYISLASDYFPLLLLLLLASSGFLMRYLLRAQVDLVTIKKATLGLVFLQPTWAHSLGTIYYLHIGLAVSLLIYIPWSKLMHMGGFFFSPTKNLANDGRKRRHLNPWQTPQPPRTYEAYEQEFQVQLSRHNLIEQPTGSVLEKRNTS